jgi:hypothetical protein
MTIHLEGQTIELPDTIAASDDLIRRALAPFYPAVAHAQIKREEKGGVPTITVIKRAEPNGRR